MTKLSIVPHDNIGRNFIPEEYLPKGKDEYFQRNTQVIPPESGWRHLRSDEIERLVKRFENVRTLLQKNIVNGQGADKEAGAALFRRPHAEQAKNIDRQEA